MPSSSQAVYQELVEIVIEQEGAIKSIQGIALNLKNAMAEAGELTKSQLGRAFDAVREAAAQVSAEYRAMIVEEAAERIRWHRDAGEVIVEQEQKLNAVLADEHRSLLEKESAQSEQAAKEAQAIAAASMKAVVAEEKGATLTLLQMQKESLAYKMAAQKEAAALETLEFTKRVQHSNMLLAAEKEIEAKHKAVFKERIEQLREEDALIKKKNEDEVVGAQHTNGQGVYGKGSLAGGLLRVGAGVAGASGDFQLAAGLYAIERSIGVIQTQLPVVVELLGVAGTTALSLVAGVAAGVVGLAAMGKDLNAELAKVSPLLITAGQSAEQFDNALHKLAEDSVDISVKFDRSLTEVVSGFKEALSSGITQDELVPFANAVGTLSNALGLPLKQASDILTAFKTEYQLTIPELNHVNDILFNMSAIGHVSVEELHKSFGRLVPVAKAAGLGLEDLAAGVTTLVRGGMSSSQAVASMSSIIEKTVSPTKNAAAAFKQLGIEFGENAFAGKSFIQFIDQLKEKTGGDLNVIGQIFHERGAKRGVSSLIELNGLLEDTRSKIGDIGTASNASNATMDTFGTHMSQMWVAVVDELKFAGNEILTAFNKIFFDTGQPMQDWLGKIRYFIAEVTHEFVTLGIEAAGAMKATWQILHGDFSAAKETVAETFRQVDKANQDYIDHLQHIKDSVNSVGEATSGSDSLSKGWKDAAAAIEDLDGKLAQYTSDVENLKEKDIKNRLSSDQSEKLKDLQAEAITVQRHIAEAAARVIQTNQSIIQDAQHALDTFMESKGAIKGEGQEDRNDWLSSLTKDDRNKWMELANQLSSAIDVHLNVKAPENLQSELDAINQQIKDIEDKALTQPLTTDQEREKKQLKKEAEELAKIDKEFRDLAIKDAEEYYNKDWELYKSTVDKKKHELDKLEHELKKEQDLISKLNEKGNERRIDAQMKRFAGNPDAQVRMLSGNFDSKSAELEKLINSGTVTQDKFKELIDELYKLQEQKASTEKDSSRAGRREDADQEIIDHLKASFDTFFQSNLKSAQDDINNRKNAVRPVTPEEAAKKGAEIAKKEITIKEQKIVNDLKINVQGLTTPELLKQISDTVILQLEKNLKNETNPKQYDNATWNNGDTQ